MLSAVLLASCADDPLPPSVAQLQPRESFIGAGVRSTKGPYFVYLEKVDQPSGALAELGQYGVPFKVVFGNLSDQPVPFGPENIRVVNGDTRLALLDDAAIQQIKQDEADSDEDDGDLAFG